MSIYYWEPLFNKNTTILKVYLPEILKWTIRCLCLLKKNTNLIFAMNRHGKNIRISLLPATIRKKLPIGYTREGN